MDILAAASIAQPPPSMLQMMSLPLNCSGQVTSEQICPLGSTARTGQAEQPNKSFVKRCCACVCALTHVLTGKVVQCFDERASAPRCAQPSGILMRSRGSWEDSAPHLCVYPTGPGPTPVPLRAPTQTGLKTPPCQRCTAAFEGRSLAAAAVAARRTRAQRHLLPA